MKHAFCVLVVVLMLAGLCAAAENVGIIGGADGPTAVFVAEAANDGPTAVFVAEATSDPNVITVPLEVPVEVTATPTIAATLEPTPEPTPEPTAVPRLWGMSVGIDPGHQAQANSDKEPIAPGSSEKKAKVSSGTSGRFTGIPEYVTNLEVSFKLRDALEALGCTVYMTRETHEVDISNIERAQMMNELGVDLVLRIHCNGSEKKSVHGAGTYARKTGVCQEESERAAHLVLDGLCEATGAKKQGVFINDNYTGQNWSTVPCIMVEMGFMTNPEEDELLNDPDYQDLLVEGMVNGICQYFER